LFENICLLGALWLGGSVIYSLTYSVFSNLVAGNLTNGTIATYGGAVYTESDTLGLRYLTDVSFSNNTVVGNKGSDIADASVNAIDFYTLESVTNCSSSSVPIRLYLVNRTTSLDCILLSLCYIWYFLNQ
jgi:hypothetical protein